MLLTLGIVLEFVGRMVIPPMTFGGQLTLVSMLPLVLISYRYGVKWGLFSGFVYSLLQMALGMNTVTAAFQPGYFGDEAMLFKAIIMILLDYVLAYTALGFGGVFRGKLKNNGICRRPLHC
jgi:thiamine transporter